MKLVTKRQARVGDLLRQTIAELIQRRVKDPRVEGVTITGVDVSVDLKLCRVFFCVFDPEKREQAQHGLDSTAGFIRHELRKELRLKHVPEIFFDYDTSFDYGTKIDELLEKLDKDEEKDS
ncbi:MAG TPA: 30S ribosome-binding factor RbfA [Deltaproteobacteria bacterium]|jgi:ribosome-binding factor A|nr:30S ribosome-binding factor RbfA [Deltaproteobacteria bacterium]HOI06382.1 30S ribosome-binding factor RbfA [Deltaproteobacteria bacterium]